MQLPSGPWFEAGNNTKGCITMTSSSWIPYPCLSLASRSGGFHPAKAPASVLKANLSSLDGVEDLTGQ
jgi:hypothetical protein